VAQFEHLKVEQVTGLCSLLVRRLNPPMEEGE